MADLWGRTDQVLMGGLSSDSMFVSWPNLATVGAGTGLGLLIQQVGLDYRQPIRRIFEIGPGVIPVGDGGIDAGFCDSTNGFVNSLTNFACATRSQATYYIVGRPEGSLQIGRFIGPNALTSCFYRTYGSACGANVLYISGKAGCSASDSRAVRVAWTLNGVVLTSERLDINGQEMVMQESLQAMFAGLKMSVNGIEGCGTGGSTSSYAPTGTSGGTGGP